MNKALEVSYWLKKQGLVYDIDYTWNRIGADYPSKFEFECKDTRYETMIALKYS